MRWPAYRHVFFDCDSTLTAVEGIDVLAQVAGKGSRVETLTRAAMEGRRELDEVYGKRLRMVRPTRKQIAAVRQVYKQNETPDARAVIAALQVLDHEVYIVSGGLAEPVIEFGIYLGVPRSHIRAVEVQYNELSGAWWLDFGDLPNQEKRYLDFSSGALTASDGKGKCVRELLGDQPGRSLLVGDGLSDLVAGRSVDLFVGYGGVVGRQRVLEEAACTLHTRSLAPVLALAAGPALLPTLAGTAHEDVANRSLALISKGALTFQNERLREKFEQAYQAIHTRPD